MPFLETQLGIALVSGAVGALISFIAQIFFRRRGVCSYSVNHNRIAVAGDDPVMGSVRITWQDAEVSNLFLSSLELRNDSSKDFQNFKVRVYTDNIMLLNESTQLADSPDILHWSNEYQKQVEVSEDGAFTKLQLTIYNGQREYSVPVLNRGQRVNLTFLNMAKAGIDQPLIWMSINHPGLVLKFRTARPSFIGVPHRSALIAGLVVSLIVIGLVANASWEEYLLAVGAFALGVFVLLPGALLIRAGAWVNRKIIG